ncbi:hypothetical protein M885DRAFT_498558 [Pelagophyceae sp. CCMP2097]|nr:hypothetical protein M885DRAFT_498558 [Pelagophyceae sp. CCMP2097]
MQQFLSACFLCLLVMWPAWLAAYFSDVAFRRLGRGGLLVPPLVFCVFAVGGLYLQLFLLFLREREAGRAFFCKMAIFYGIAPLLLILLVGSALQESREPYASLLLLTMFCGASAVVASTIKIIYKYQVLKATPPIILFAILLSQHRARLPILVGPLGPLRGRLYVVFAPAFVLFGMACWLHIHLPYLWEATFYTQKLDRALLRPPADDQAKDSEDEGPVEL